MSNFTELLVSFETYCAVLAREEFEQSFDKPADQESARIQSETLFRQYMARCTDLARSDHIRARYAPSLEELAKSKSRGTTPGKEELEEAKVDAAIIELYRHMFGPHVFVDASLARACPDWQTAVVNAFETKEQYRQAIQPVTRTHKNLMRQKGGLDSHVAVVLKVTDAYERARERMFEAGLLVGRYHISSELWEFQEGQYEFTKRVELNKSLADPNRETGFVCIDRRGDLVHSYHLASTVKNSSGETITSPAGDLSPVLLVPHSFEQRLNEPTTVCLIDFGKQQNYRLKIVLLSKIGQGPA
jgi:hypothetical protein